MRILSQLGAPWLQPLDSYERDRAKARNVGIVGDKAVSAVRRLECDAQASFCHDHVTSLLTGRLISLTRGSVRLLRPKKICQTLCRKADPPND